MNAREFLEQRERQALAGLRLTTRRLGRDLAILVPQTARRHPRASVAGALFLGLASGYLVGPLGRGARKLPASLGLLAFLGRTGGGLLLRRFLRP